MTQARDRRVTLALKWHYLDHCDVEDIQERFARAGVDLTKSTIRDYLNEQPREEVIEQIEGEQADARLQIAEREERKHKRARQDEREATRDEPIKRVVPVTERVPRSRKTPRRVRDWEVLNTDHPDRPAWATDSAVIIRFLDRKTEVAPGEEYPVPAIDGSPRYTKEFHGFRRDQPDLTGQAMARKEQSEHLEQKGEALGVFTDHIQLEGSLETESTVGVDEETKAIARELLAERYNQDADSSA